MLGASMFANAILLYKMFTTPEVESRLYSSSTAIVTNRIGSCDCARECPMSSVKKTQVGMIFNEH